MLSPLPGTNTMIIGESGVGKTYALRTLLDAGLTPFCIFTEPRFEVVGDTPPDKFHWAYVAPSLEELSGIERKLQDITSMSYEAMLRKSDTSRSKENRLIPFIQLLNDFKCERTGKSFGPVKSWGTDRVLVLDTLTGFCKMVWSAVIGSKS